MKPTTPDELVQRYLRQLRGELRDLPADRRREVLDEVAEHIAVRRSEPEVRTVAEVRAMLDRLGDPALLGADARERFDVAPRRSGPLEATVLLFGGLGPILVLVPSVAVGTFLPWLVVPAVVGVLLWLSRLWQVRDKLVGTALLLGVPVIPPTLSSLDETGGLYFMLGVLLLLGGLFGGLAGYLSVRRARLTVGTAPARPAPV